MTQHVCSGAITEEIPVERVANLRKSLQVIQTEEQEQLCIEDLASTQDLVKAHDRLSSKIQ